MIKYLIMDVDGTLTDGKIYMGPNGEAMKAFSIKDGYVINYILKPMNIIPVIITARISSIVQHRCNELGITKIYQGKLEKMAALQDIVGKEHIGDCAYFGDDILDLKCMLPVKESGGIVGCPADAVKEVKAIADYVCTSRAGEGALREFSEWLVKPKIDGVINEKRVFDALNYLKGISISEIDIGKKISVNEDFFYSIQSYVTKAENECRLESHRKYVEIQIMIKGNEAMDLCDVSRLDIKEDYDEEKDIIFWKIPHRMTRITLKDGDYVILYPENAHRGAVSIKTNDYVLKIVGKIVC